MLLRVQGGVETGFGWKEKLPDDWESTVIALIWSCQEAVWCILWTEERR